MKSVPVCASEKRPSRCSTAPVNAPLAWPRRWLSMRPSGIVVQSSVMSGAAARAGAVDRAGDEPLTGAALPADADVGVAGGDPFDA